MMRSMKWKVIIIKDSHLRKIRRVLRTLVKLAIHTQFEYLRKLRSLHRNRRILGKQTPSQWKREVALSRMIDDLLQVKTNSILRCSMGSACKSPEAKQLPHDVASLDKDMIWNPLSKNWVCIDCYNVHFGTQQQKELLQKVIKDRKAEEEEITKMLND